MTSTRNLEVDFVLAFELDFAVIQFSRKIHGAIQANQRVASQSGVLLNFGGVIPAGFHAGLHGHSVCPRSLTVSSACNSNYTEMFSAVRNTLRRDPPKSVQFGLPFVRG